MAIRRARALAVACARMRAGAACAPALSAAALCLAGALACRGEQSYGGHAASGVLVGRVRLVEGAALPAYAPSDLARVSLYGGTLRGDLPAACSAAAQAARRPVQLTAHGLLSGVAVAASDFTRTRTRAPAVHRVAIRQCRLQPSSVAAMAGDTLALENDDAFAFAPLLGPSYTPKPLAPGGRTLMSLIGGRVESIQCSRAAPCGRTDVFVFNHPVYALTDARGEFRIADFPPSELVRVTAWHPLFEESETYVWVEPGKTASVELVLQPRSRFAAPAQ